MLRKCLDGDNSYAELVSPYSNKNTWKTPCRCSIINENSRKSSQFDMQNDRKLFCHNDFFNYMNSRKTLSIRAISMDLRATTFTGIATMDYDPISLILVVSTLNADIIMLKYEIASNLAVKYDEISVWSAVANASSTVSAHSAMNMNLALIDTSTSLIENNRTNIDIQRTLFVTYDRFLFKVDLQNCEQFSTCESCLGIRPSQTVSNPFCGWCVYEQKCMLKQTCSRKTILGRILFDLR